MKIIMLAGIMITLPAIIVVLSFFGGSMMLPALASLLINFTPFVVAGLLLRRQSQNKSAQS